MATQPFILYIEDERFTLEMARQAFRLSGYQLAGATTGQQGLAIMRERKPDVLLLDLMMPNFNGWDVYREIKSDDYLADVPVIVVTAKNSEPNHILIDDLPPVDDYITKPFDVERLLQSVQHFLHTSGPARPIEQ